MAVKPPAAVSEPAGPEAVGTAPAVPGPGPAPAGLAVAAGRVDAAAAGLRRRPETGWDQARDQVFAAVRRARRWSFPVRGEVVGSPGPGGSISVSEQVLATLIGRAVSTGHPCTVDDMTIALDRTELRGVTVVVRARYGHDLHAVGRDVRATVLRVLSEVLGASISAGMTDAVSISIEDVTVADPRTV